MPEFLNPFSGMVPARKLTLEELIRAIRLDLAAEHEADGSNKLFESELPSGHPYH